MNDYGNLFPLQVNQSVSYNAELFQIICSSVLLAAVIIYAIERLVRHRDSILLFTMCAGIIPFFNAGNIGVLLHITQPANSMLPVFRNYGMPVPLGFCIGYVAIFPLVSYIAYRFIKNGIDTKGFITLWALLCLVDLLVEVPAVIAGIYIYQPPQMLTIFGFPLYNVWINGTSWLLGGVMMYFFVPVLTDWRRPAISLLPFFGFAAGWGIMDVPIVLALNAEGMPSWGQWVLWLVSLGFSIIILSTLNSIIASDSDSRWELPWEELIR